MPSARRLSRSLVAFQRPALIVGHPGHELKVFGWLCAVRPRVYLITDGSGRHGVPRTTATEALITSAGAKRGEVFGLISDAEIYRAILDQNFSFFLMLVDKIADSFLDHEIDSVAGDAAEGFNPTHDICRTVINAAVLSAERRGGTPIANFEFCLTEWERNSPKQEHDSRCLHLNLDDQMLSQKLAAAEAYVELRNEVRKAIASRGKDYFRLECVRRVVSASALRSQVTRPVYETWGEQRVAEGEYWSVIRYEKHVLPIMEAILDHAAQAAPEALHSR
jgi:hypothetical protein